MLAWLVHSGKHGGYEDLLTMRATVDSSGVAVGIIWH